MNTIIPSCLFRRIAKAGSFWSFIDYSFSVDKTHLIVLVPGQRLGGEDKPVLLGSSLHDADVVDGQPALPDHLRNDRQKAKSDNK